MSKYYDKAVELRAVKETHYNCAQAVVVPFAEDAGISEEAAYKIAENFGRGLKMAATCGSIAGGLMVLGLFDVGDSQTIAEYYRRLKENHQGCLACADLLRISKEEGKDKRKHCDDMVYECVCLIEDILKEKGKL